MLRTMKPYKFLIRGLSLAMVCKLGRLEFEKPEVAIMATHFKEPGFLSVSATETVFYSSARRQSGPVNNLNTVKLRKLRKPRKMTPISSVAFPFCRKTAPVLL